MMVVKVIGPLKFLAKTGRENRYFDPQRDDTFNLYIGVFPPFFVI